MGPMTTLLQAEQIGMGSGPGTSLSQTEPEEDVESKLYTFSPKRNSRRCLSGRFPGTGWVGSFDGGVEGELQVRGHKESKVTNKAKEATWSVTRLGTAFKP